MKLRTRTQRLLGMALVIALLGSLTLVGASGLAVVEQELLVNGDFEGGFVYVPGCGNVGKGWGCFTNGGSVDYGFYDDQWQPVVASGAHSQLIELSTVRHQATQTDRYAGIYQTVKLVKGQKYQFQVKGLMRELNSLLYDAVQGDAKRSGDPKLYEERWRASLVDEDAWRYRVQWGFTTDGATDWSKVSNWAELPWDKIDIRTSPTGFQSFSTTFAAPSDKITLFIRVWKKWATSYRDLEVNLDAISLFGLAVQQPVTPADPVVILPGPVTPGLVTPAVCGGKDYIANGDFEAGFTGGVGKGWTAFNNGGRAAYGFYDEQWARVIKDGAHDQLIEINTIGLQPADNDRYAGIYQVVSGLTKGSAYEFSLWGLLRESTTDDPESAAPIVVPSLEDPNRYQVQWGFAAADGNPSETDITNWTGLSLGKVYWRRAPGEMSSASVKFEAASAKIVIGVRVWKKWGIPDRELNLNLDAIKLTGCACPPEGCACTGVYTVVKGDTLSGIAAKYGASVEALAQKNNLAAPYTLYVGQQLSVPCDGGAVPIPPQDECIWVTVAPGDTVFGLALKYNSSVALIMERNKLANPNLIYVGQKLCIVDP